MKQRINITIDEYVLNKLKEKGINNISAFFEQKGSEWLNQQKTVIKVKKCSRCLLLYEYSKNICPHCQCLEYETREITD